MKGVKGGFVIKIIIKMKGLLVDCSQVSHKHCDPLLNIPSKIPFQEFSSYFLHIFLVREIYPFVLSTYLPNKGDLFICIE
jgi:hypothetical protein